MKAYRASRVVRTIAGLRASSVPFIFHGSASVRYLVQRATGADRSINIT